MLRTRNNTLRPRYEEFKKLNGSEDFFYFLHSAGRLENNVSVDIDKRRIYIDLEENTVYTVNNQYAGNSVGLKSWLQTGDTKSAKRGMACGAHVHNGRAWKPGRTTYFTGAFPSACGKTSTAMIPGQPLSATI